MTSAIVIPARMASSRLPGKMLLAETGKTLIAHTYEAACRATKPETVIVATDHEDILREVERFGGRGVLTDPALPSGTDRVAVVARDLPRVDIVVNVQGDEPELSGASIDLVIELLEQNPRAEMSTLATPIRRRAQFDDPACVKVVFDPRGRALYFSRSPIPHPRSWDEAYLHDPQPALFQHVGMYAYRREFLLELATLPPSRLEQLEKLEQLRVLEAGHEILVGLVDEPTFGIDTPEDYRVFVERRRQG